MRNLTIRDIVLHPSTDASSFERAMADEVLPNAGDELQHPDTLFVRSLYRAADESFPPLYRCIVDSIWVTDGGFFAMRDKVRDLGADASKQHFRLLASVLPNHDEALEAERSGLSRGMVMLTVHLPFGPNPGEAAFAKDLVAALKDEVGVQTRVNNVQAALVTADDSVVLGNTEYLVVAIGDYMQPELRPDTIAQIEAAGGKIVASQPFTLVATVPGPDPGHIPDEV